ncbi:MAG TPA: shikimate kinase AroL [Planctomycetota bacterium]|nr:shikimate kinase AroL [Planctomycetota bacterium]
MRIFLVGARASGKTSVGRSLAERLRVSFADTDDLVSTIAGALAGDLLRTKREPALRAAESAVLARLCEVFDGVVATGGGVVLSEKNRDRMRRGGFVVYLRAGAETLAARIRAEGEGTRPSLTGAPPDEEVSAVLAAREPLYAEIAHLVLDATRPVAELVSAIASALPPPPGSAAPPA